MNSKKNLHPGTGLATILLIFVVLSMTILALFTYMRAQQDHQSLKREYDQKQKYYQADARAKYIVKEILNGTTLDQIENQMNILIETERNVFDFEISISNSQVLYVRFDQNGKIYDWKIQTRNEE